MRFSAQFFGVLLSTLLCLQVNSSRAADRPQLSHYSGSLIRPGGDESEILRRFECLLIQSPTTAFFHVLDDPRRGCPWPDSFGRFQAAAENLVQPHLTYQYEDSNYFLSLPPLVLTLPDQANENTEWKVGAWTYQLLERTELDQEAVWAVEAREPRGRRQKLLINQQTGTLVQAEMDVFMGRGDRFQMTVRRISAEPVPTAQIDSIAATQENLLKLQSTLNRRPDAVLAELSERQIQDAAAALDDLNTASEGTPLQRLVSRIKTDVEQQQTRVSAVASQAGAMVNSRMPAFALQLIHGGTLESASLAGKTTILHFWEYRDKPLSEPYGQTGYLEFLFNRYRSKNVAVVGICCNPELLDPSTVRQAQRSARKTAEFMNLSYPIGGDDGSLLKTVGDPRDSRGQLPLWIVISPDGKVVHYHAGFYEIDAATGLKQLDEIVQAGLK
jgi:hypothetical protein